LILSWVLFAAAFAVLVAMGVIYYRDRQEDQEPPPPPTRVGANELIHVVNALRDQDLEVEIMPRTARNDHLTEVGQVLDVDGATLVVFLYLDIESREAESKVLDAADFGVTTASGTPVASGTPHLVSASNAVAALYGGSETLVEKVDAAINGLP
jgi:hypothetical protein